MFISKGKASIVLWIACIAIFLATLAPTVSRALTVAGGRAVPSLEIAERGKPCRQALLGRRRHAFGIRRAARHQAVDEGGFVSKV